MLKNYFSPIFVIFRDSFSSLKQIRLFMKTKILIVVAILITVLVISCKKEDLTSVPVTASSFDASYTETDLTVQKPITHKIDANIGGYVEALPAHYSDHPTLKYPLIIYLHGSGSMGDGSQSSLTKVEHDGIPNWITSQKFPSNFTVSGTPYQFIVLAPQFKAWPQPSDVNDMLNYAIGKYRLNYEKIYIVGNSMGGGVAWDYAWNYGKRITGIVPVSGASWPTTEKAAYVAADTVAVWGFHNSGDSTVPAWYTTDYVQYINNCHPYIPAKATIFQASGHSASTKAFDPTYEENGMNIYDWMLSYKKVKYTK